MTESVPKLLDYLPAIYQEDTFLQKFLLAFDDILLGNARDTNFPAEGLEQTISQLSKLFDPSPNGTPDEFLSWLAEWTAFTVRNDLEPIQQRAFIARVIPLYRRRGTKENLKELLTIFVRGEPTIIEPGVTEFQIGITSQIGVDTFLAGGAPHYFEVTINIPKGLDPKLQLRQIEIARALIELEKPAHTYYKLNSNVLDTIQIGRKSTIGVDTVLGTPPPIT
jgi:phage tail-like protein